MSEPTSRDPFLKWAQENTDLLPSEPEPDPEPFDAEAFWAGIEAQRAQPPSLSSGGWVRTLAVCTMMLSIIMMATLYAVWQGVQDLDASITVPPIEVVVPAPAPAPAPDTVPPPSTTHNPFNDVVLPDGETVGEKGWLDP